MNGIDSTDNPTTPKWEYKFFIYPNPERMPKEPLSLEDFLKFLEVQMDEMGLEGWELVGNTQLSFSTPIRPDSSSQGVFIFKRRIQ